MKKQMEELIFKNVMCTEVSLSIKNLKKISSLELFLFWKIFSSLNTKKKFNWNCAARLFTLLVEILLSF
jgi:hypothetical protein